VGWVVGIEQEQGAGAFHLDDVSTEQESLGSLSHNYLYRWRRGSS
jgi:hypothetical protein